MSIEELYKQKGELITQIEVAQAKLQAVNQKIVEIINTIQSKQEGIEQ